MNKDNSNLTAPFLKYKQNHKFINGESSWTGQQHSDFSSVVVFLVMFLITLIASTFGYLHSSSQIDSRFIFFSLILLVFGSLTLLRSYLFWRNYRLNKLAKLLDGEITQFTVPSGKSIPFGDSVTIIINYKFISPENNTIIGVAKTEITNRKDLSNIIHVGKPVVVQFLNNENFDLL
jgi:hypothetical protein